MKMKCGFLYLLVAILLFAAPRTAFSQSEPALQSASFPITISSRTDGPDHTASEIFADVSPAIAFVETPVHTGSAVLIEHDFLLTNAHVVWPHDRVRVVFSDGSEHSDVPIFAWDLMADLALIGPIKTDIDPLPLVDGSGIEIGSDVYLIGYPLEVDSLPQPSITSGILSRVRQWDTFDLSLFQADATTSGGQSGGVMVTPQGDVIGISSFDWDGFAMATSVADALPRLKALLAQDEDATLGMRKIDFSDGSVNHAGTLLNDWDEQTFVLDLPRGTEVELAVDGVGYPYFTVVDEFGESVVDSHAKGETAEVATFTVYEGIPHYVQVRQYSGNQNSFTLTGSHPLIAYDDQDDGKILKGSNIAAAIDTPSDTDFYEVYLRADEKVEIGVDSLGLDLSLWLIYSANDREELVGGVYSGGIFGQNGKIVYSAPASGIQTVAVMNNGDPAERGGYILSMAKADPSAEPSMIVWERDLIITSAGLMALHESQDHGFQMGYPADWQVLTDEGCEPGVNFCADGFGASLTVAEDDLSSLQPYEKELGLYVDQMLDYIESSTSEFELVNRERILTMQGLEVETYTFSADYGMVIVTGFVYIDEVNDVAYAATYYGPGTQHQWLKTLSAESFATFRSWNDVVKEDDPIYFLDEGMRYLSGRNFPAALTALSTAIEMDPKLGLAFALRANAHFALNDTESLFADLDHAISLEPDNWMFHYNKADLHYRQGQYSEAKSAIDEAIALEPEDSRLYTMRAKIQAIQGNYKRALSDLYITTHVVGGGSYVSGETSGFVHLMTDDLEQAKADYDELFNIDWRTPHVLLGRGIVYAQLGEDVDIARNLLQEGIKDALKFGFSDDPQLEKLYEIAKDAKRQLD